MRLKILNFVARPFRTQGTYSKYNSIDDKIDDHALLHNLHVKFGIGRATYDASQEIRNKHLTREEGQALVKSVRWGVPRPLLCRSHGVYWNETTIGSMNSAMNFGSPHLWKKKEW